MKGEAGHAQDDEYGHYGLDQRAAVGCQAGSLGGEAPRGQGGKSGANCIVEGHTCGVKHYDLQAVEEEIDPPENSGSRNSSRCDGVLARPHRLSPVEL